MFCQKCGKQIDDVAVICPMCGVATSNYTNQQPQIVINNSNTNSNVNSTCVPFGRAKNKWVALALCFFLGLFGAHKFYENKIGMGVLYIFTVGLFGIGAIVDFIVLLFKPNPYYV